MWTRCVAGWWSVQDRGSKAGSSKRRGPVQRTLYSSECPAFQESSGTGLTFEDSTLNDDLPAREHGFGHPAHFTALVGAVIDAHVMRSCADGLFTVGIEDHHVRIRSHSNCALPRKHPEDLRRRGGCQLD